MKSFRLIGDPHMGRKFEAGVPLHRKGERERMQMDLLRSELAHDVDCSIMVGDLFDHPYVSHAVVLEVAEAYLEASGRRQNTAFLLLAGNHDRPRNVEAVGAWELFAAIVRRRPNIFIVNEPTIIDGFALFPWQWGVDAESQVSQIAGSEADIAVGHWDLQSFGGDNSHLVPTKSLIERFGINLVIFSGHYHLPGGYKVDGIPVMCTGSMQPYTHSEDPTGELYVTMTLDELEQIDSDTLKNKCVRIELEPGQELPDLDCLSITAKMKSLDDEEDLQIDATDDFNFAELLAQKLEDVAVPVREFIYDELGKYDEV